MKDNVKDSETTYLSWKIKLSKLPQNINNYKH